MVERSTQLPAIEVEIEHVRSLGLETLRTRWRTTFEGEPPVALSKDLLARMIAYRLQEEAFGGLDRAEGKLLDGFARGHSRGTEVRRRLKAGTVLVREYKGERHTVTVAPDGFVWRGVTYSSLSTIARAITGTAWGGPRFFGLRGPNADGEQSRTSDKATAESTRGGRLRSRSRSRAVGPRQVQT